MDGFLDALFNDKDGRTGSERFAVAPGTVTNNLDLLSEGRVQVRITAHPDGEVWARVASPGGGSGRGLLWLPQRGDEVLVAFAQNEAKSAYVIGGLWNTRDRPPLSAPPAFLTTRVIRTGMSDSPLAHEITLDDLKNSITIKTSTEQTITLTPEKIEISGTGGKVSVTIDTKTQSISLVAPARIELQATQISLKGKQIDIEGDVNVNVKSSGTCNVTGTLIKLN